MHIEYIPEADVLFAGFSSPDQVGPRKRGYLLRAMQTDDMYDTVSQCLMLEVDESEPTTLLSMTYELFAGAFPHEDREYLELLLGREVVLALERVYETSRKTGAPILQETQLSKQPSRATLEERARVVVRYADHMLGVGAEHDPCHSNFEVGCPCLLCRSLEE